MSKILITGGAGFIGYHLAKTLSKQGEKVYLIDNFSNSVNDVSLEKLCKNGVKLYEWDLKDIIDFDKVNKFDTVYYLADTRNLDIIAVNPYEYIDSTLGAIRDFFQCKYFKKIIFGSTCEVYYRNVINEDIPENKLISSFNTYITTKLMAEELIATFCKESDLHYNIVRFGNVFGERMSEDNVMYKYVKQALKNKRFFHCYNPHFLNTFYYVEDAISDLITIGNGYPDGIFNIGSEELINNRSIVDLLTIITKVEYKVEEKKKKTYIPEIFRPDIDKFKYYFPEERRTQFASGLKKTCTWYRKEGIRNELQEKY